jgi:CheY-like chemotaxis protein
MGPSPKVQGAPPSVLVCNAEPSLRLLVHATLDLGDYSVSETSDGREALAHIRAEQPDLIVLETMMARLSGADVLAAVREDPAVASTPVIMLTARAQTARETGDANAAHYVTMPFSPFDLARLVGELLAADADLSETQECATAE